MRDEPLLPWQWRLYPDGHRDRTNLVIHVVTQPLFVLGLAAVIAAPITGILWLATAGLGGVVFAMVMQKRGHARERTAPVPFDGPLDAVSRLFVEQLVTFPRFVLSGGLSRAWRAAGERPAEGGASR